MILTTYLNLESRLGIDLYVLCPLCIHGMDRENFALLTSCIHNLYFLSDVIGTVNIQAGSGGQSMWHAWEG
jgi:hypothetical protein